MRTDHSWHRLRFPSLVEPDGLTNFLRSLHGLSRPGGGTPFIFEIVAKPDQIEHYLAIPVDREAAIRRHATAVPGLVLDAIDAAPDIAPQAAWRLWLSSSRRPLRDAVPAETASTILTALTGLVYGETVVLQWLLGPVRRPVVVPANHAGQLNESWPWALLSALVFSPKQPDIEARRALRLKQGEAGWRAVGRIAVQAANRERGHALLGQTLGALRTAEGPGAALGIRPIRPQTVVAHRQPWFWGLALSISEFTGLAAWPLGDGVSQLPVLRRRARLLPVPALVPRRGRVLAVDPSSERAIASSNRDALQHFWVTGPTGSGKSTLLLNLIIQDLQAGRACVVIEPKGDLIQDVLARIPAHRLGDVVLLDPTDSQPVGINPLADAVAPDLVADQLLTIFARLNADSWGPRLAETLHTALLTLARTPGMSLAALPPLLTNDQFRRRITGSLDDPLGVSPIWAAFERLSEEARAQTVAAVLNKVRVLTARPDLRAVLGQTVPRFQLQSLFSRERPILLANLAKGRLGPDSARLLGTVLLNQLWNLALGRSQTSPERRHLVSVYVDELQDYAGLPADLGDMLAQARGLGVAFHVANQFAKQLPTSLLDGVLANARSRVVFQTDSADAGLLARGHREVTPEDFTQLPVHEAYLRLSVDGEITPYFSGRTLPPSETSSHPGEIAQLSQGRYGVSRRETDQALRRLVEGQHAPRPIGTARRRS